MKIRITLKDPDGIHECLTDALNTARPAGITDDEWSSMLDGRRRAITHRWFKYGDYCDIEIDTDLGTARILSVAEQGG